MGFLYPQCLEETFCVLGGRIKKQVNIASQARVSIGDDGLTPHDQVPHGPPVKDAKKVKDLLGKRRLRHARSTGFPPAPGCRTRTAQDARTSGHWRPKNRLCSSRAASRRFSGVMESCCATSHSSASRDERDLCTDTSRIDNDHTPLGSAGPSEAPCDFQRWRLVATEADAPPGAV